MTTRAPADHGPALHVEVVGKGPPLVLLHGWAMHGGAFAPLAERLAPRFTLHLVDLPGHGFSRDSGVPLRLEIGPRDVAGNTVMLARRTGGKKESLSMAGLPARVQEIMDAMQRDLLETARARREANSIRGATREQFLAAMRGDGGFVYAGFCGEGSCEAAIKEETKATVRVLPDDASAVEFHKVMTPSGKTGFVAAGALRDVSEEQLCYVKELGGWKIAGFFGGEPSQ